MFVLKYGCFLSICMHYNYAISNLLRSGLCSSVPENTHFGGDLVNTTDVHKLYSSGLYERIAPTKDRDKT
jgi:hypothetical protein